MTTVALGTDLEKDYAVSGLETPRPIRAPHPTAPSAPSAPAAPSASAALAAPATPAAPAAPAAMTRDSHRLKDSENA